MAYPQLSAQNYVDQVREHLQNRAYDTAKQLLVEGLKENKLTAQLWVFLGEALEQLGDLNNAWAAYDRGWILDPQAGWAPLAKERVYGRVTSEPDTWMMELLRVPHVSVAGAMIVRNEERTIGESIRCLKPAVDEVIVVDTGSTDRTVEIAKQMGARVYTFEWCDDFSAARNYALSKVNSDWVLWVDADELLFAEDCSVPRVTAGLFNDVTPTAILRIVQVNKMGGVYEPNYDMSRFFPMRHGLKFWGRIHEQIGPSEGGIFSAEFTRPVVRIRLNHDGYEAEVMNHKRKLQRNIDLLRKSVEDDPNDVASWGFLGRELFFTGNLDEAVKALYHTEHLSYQNPKYGRVPEIRTYLVEALIALNRHHEAIVVSERAVKDSPNFPAAWFGLGKAQMGLALRMLAESNQAFLKVGEVAPTYRGIVSYDTQISKWKATAALGDVYKLQGDFIKAYDTYQQALIASPGNNALQGQIQSIEAQVQMLSGKIAQR